VLNRISERKKINAFNLVLEESALKQATGSGFEV